MKELSAQYPRYGYRWIRIFLGRDGFAMSVSRAWRLWSDHGLQLPRGRPRKGAASGRPRPLAPTRANQVCSHDLEFDACANGQQLKCPTLIDEFTKKALVKWATQNKIETALIDPGKPWQNGATKRFNGKFRDECPSVESGEANVNRAKV